MAHHIWHTRWILWVNGGFCLVMETYCDMQTTLKGWISTSRKSGGSFGASEPASDTWTNSALAIWGDPRSNHNFSMVKPRSTTSKSRCFFLSPNSHSSRVRLIPIFPHFSEWLIRPFSPWIFWFGENVGEHGEPTSQDQLFLRRALCEPIGL